MCWCCANLLVEFQAVHGWHCNVRQNDVDLFLFYDANGFDTILRDNERVAKTAHDHLQHLEVFRLIFDCQDFHNNSLPLVAYKIRYCGSPFNTDSFLASQGSFL